MQNKKNHLTLEMKFSLLNKNLKLYEIHYTNDLLFKAETI